MVPVECVARGYLAGYGLDSYRASGGICGVPLPGGLAEGSRLPDPVFTPTTKAPPGQHDEPMTFDEVIGAVGAKTAAELRRLTLEVYQRGHDIARGRGIIIADTKLEFGWAADGSLVLADEVLTSDSSRFWPADSWQPGRPQYAFDKQVVRDWAAASAWDRTAPGPQIPAEVVEATRQRYIEAYERLTGTSWRRWWKRAERACCRRTGRGRTPAACSTARSCRRPPSRSARAGAIRPAGCSKRWCRPW